MRGLYFLLAVVCVAVLAPHGDRASAAGPRVVPFARASPLAWPRSGRAVAAGNPEPYPSPGTRLVDQGFDDEKTPPNAFAFIDQACLTAGTKQQPGSVPPCGNLAPQDKNGHGVLENTNLNTYLDSWVSYQKPLSTLLGIQVAFTIYSWGGGGADGQLLFFTDASMGPPNNIGQNGGELGYTGGGENGPPGLNYAYVGIGFDEFGTFSENNAPVGLNGGVGHIPETIAVRGAAATGYYYIGGALDPQGQPASLPFNWNQSSPQRPSTGPTVFVTLSPTGYLTVAVDIHNGAGFITYYAQSIVGVAGEPPVPESVYIGITGSNGGVTGRHQIGDLNIWSM